MTRRAVVSRVIREWTVQFGPMLPVGLVHFRRIFDKSTFAYRNCRHQPYIACILRFYLVKISPLEAHHGLRTVHLKIFEHDPNYGNLWEFMIFTEQLVFFCKQICSEVDIFADVKPVFIFSFLKIINFQCQIYISSEHNNHTILVPKNSWCSYWLVFEN